MASERLVGVKRRLLKEQEISLVTGFSRRTLQGWRLRGGKTGPPWVKVGGSVRYDLEAFERWLAEQPGGGAA